MAGVEEWTALVGLEELARVEVEAVLEAWVRRMVAVEVVLEAWVRWMAEVLEVGVGDVWPWMVSLILSGAVEVWTWLREPEEPGVGCHLIGACGRGFQNWILRLVSGEACEDSPLKG